MGPQMVFKRYEIKYRMTCRQQAAILRAMEAHMQADEHGSVRSAISIMIRRISG